METFMVEFKPDASNLAYTADELGPHTDLPYYGDMPEIQGLHCIRAANAMVGGENQFVDLCNVSEQIKRDHPEHYRILSTIHLEHLDDMEEKGMHYRQVSRRPVFNLDKDGNFVFGCFNNMQRSWYYPGTPEEVKAIYDAMFTLREYYSKLENMFQIRLKPGQFAIFDNLRVMHARSAYEITPETDRFLEGIYYTWDSVRSKIRCLRHKLGKDDKQAFG